MLKRYRFKTNSVDDFRPLVDMSSINMPWWCTGEAGDGTYATIVCYLPAEEDLMKYWDDAYDIDVEDVEEIKYSSRFPKPTWIKDKADKNKNVLFELKETICPKCAKEITKLEQQALPGVSEFWCDQCNLRVTIVDRIKNLVLKKPDTLNVGIPQFEPLNLDMLRLCDEDNPKFIEDIKKSLEYDDTAEMRFSIHYGNDKNKSDNIIIDKELAKELVDFYK